MGVQWHELLCSKNGISGRECHQKLRARGKERKLAWQGLRVLATFCRGGYVCVGDVLVLVMLMMLMMLMMTMLI